MTHKLQFNYAGISIDKLEIKKYVNEFAEEKTIALININFF